MKITLKIIILLNLVISSPFIYATTGISSLATLRPYYYGALLIGAMLGLVVTYLIIKKFKNKYLWLSAPLNTAVLMLVFHYLFEAIV